MKNPTIFKSTLLVFSCVLLTVLGLAILNSDLNADATTTIGLDINTGNITSSGTITSQDLTVQKEGDATLTVYSNTDGPTADSKLLVVQKGITPSELFSVDEDGDVAIANDLAVAGNITAETPIAPQYGGTGQDWSAIAQGNIPYFSGTGALSNLAPGTAGQFLSQGSDGNPKWDNVARSATFVVAASDSLNKEQADYVCNGVDDQVEIQEAIDALPSSGGKVLLMAGTYILSDYISLDNYTTLQGQGAGNTIITGKVVRGISVNDIVVRDLQVKNGSPHCIDFENVYGGLIENCIVEHAADDGIAVSGENTYGVIIKGNICRNNASSTNPSGIELDNGARNVIIMGNICHDNGNTSTTWGGGIVIHTHASEPTIKDVTVSNNLCYSNTNNIWLENPVGNAVTMEKISITGNILRDASVQGLETENIYDTVIGNNVFDNNGFTVDEYSKRISITNNVFIGKSVSISGNDCLFISNKVYNVGDNDHGVYISGKVAVIGNLVSESDRAGIRLVAGADHSVVSNNIIMNNGQARTTHMYGLSIDSVNDVVIANNRCGDDQSTKTQDYGMYILNSDYVIITDNNVRGNAVASAYIGGSVSNAKISNNIGYTTESSGTATLAKTTTSIVVDHGLDVTPSAGDIMVTPIGNWGNMTKFWIGNYTSTQFTIYADQDPGQDVDFAWKAAVL